MDDKEYEMLRTGILQYLGEYQEVRNMMYVVTAALFGFGVYEGHMSDVAPAIFLLPSIVRVNCQLIPYVVCAISCLVLYFMNMDVQNCRHWIVGIAALTANVWVWKKVKKSDRQEYLAEWRRIKKEERQSS